MFDKKFGGVWIFSEVHSLRLRANESSAMKIDKKLDLVQTFQRITNMTSDSYENSWSYRLLQ